MIIDDQDMEEVVTDSSDLDPPAFDEWGSVVAPEIVYTVIYGELLLFAGFGLTQFVQFILYDNGSTTHYETIEAAYIVQSLISKTMLGWLIYGGNFA